MTIPPVLFVGFNRPEVTATSFARLREVAPPRLFVALDGPRDRAGEAERCAAVESIVRDVDWKCEVDYLVRKHNLGCQLAVSSAVDWLFDHVGAGVILEDDCLPSRAFFPYAAELLDRYAEDNRVWMVSGTNLAGRWRPRRSSYFFGEGGVWGWATWRRAWKHADIQLRSWNDPQARRRAERFFGPLQWRMLAPAFAATARGDIDTWDYGWSFTRATWDGLGVIPSRNLVRNIGFRADATHTIDASPFADITAQEIELPLRHPRAVEFDRGYQRRVASIQARSALTRRLRRVTQR